MIHIQKQEINDRFSPIYDQMATVNMLPKSAVIVLDFSKIKISLNQVTVLPTVAFINVSEAVYTNIYNDLSEGR